MSENNPFEENVFDLVHRPGEMRERQRTVTLSEQWGEGLAHIAEGEPIDIDLRLEAIHEGILVTATARTTMQAECGRCLEPFSEPVQVEIAELFAYTPTEADDYGVHGDHVNLEPLIRDAVVLALPFQPVDREDCPGLNPETGELSDPESEANRSQAIDPRWAALAGFQAETDHGEGETPSPETK